MFALQAKRRFFEGTRLFGGLGFDAGVLGLKNYLEAVFRYSGRVRSRSAFFCFLSLGDRVPLFGYLVASPDLRLGFGVVSFALVFAGGHQ